MKIISVINYKGGVGKTTLTSNLGGELAYRGYKVLLIDLDPQASLTFSFIKPEEWRKDIADSATIKNWFKPSKKHEINFGDLIIAPERINRTLPKEEGELHLVSSHLELINVDLELATQLTGANLQQAKENFLKVHRRLLDGLQQIDGEYDIVLIDCPPNFNIVTKNAIVASDYILIPAKPDYLSTMGIDYLKSSLDRLVNDYNDFCSVEDENEYDDINPEIAGVVFTMVQFYGGEPISALRPYIAQTRMLKIPVFENPIRENKTLYADAPQYGLPVVLTDSHRPDIVSELENFVDEFEAKILV